MEPLATLREELPDWTLAITRLDGDNVMGFCDVDKRTIWVDSRLSTREMRSTIMHEVLHALRQDRMDDPASELAVQVESARRLVPVHSLASGFRMTTHPEDLCDLLDVDIDTLRTRIKYLNPNEGSLVRRILTQVLPHHLEVPTQLCALGRWWVGYGQPGDPPCNDGCGDKRPRIGIRSTRRKDEQWRTSNVAVPLAAASRTASAT